MLPSPTVCDIYCTPDPHLYKMYWLLKLTGAQLKTNYSEYYTFQLQYCRIIFIHMLQMRHLCMYDDVAGRNISKAQQRQLFKGHTSGVR